MATISASNVSALMSSVAKHISDLEALVGSTGAIVTGQGTTEGKIAALNDFSQQSALVSGFAQFVTNETGLLTSLTTGLPTTIYIAAIPACQALEKATGGLDAFLAANSIQAPTLYANAHNYCASATGTVAAIASGHISSGITPTY